MRSHGENLRGLARRFSESAVLRGTAWLTAGRVIVQISTLARIVILARFISPTEFGVLAIALVVMQILEAFTSPGLDQALVQHKGQIEAMLSTVFWTKAFRGLALGAFLVAIAGLISSFFDVSEVHQVIQATGIVFVIRGLSNPALAQVHRELRFRSIFSIDVTSSAAGFFFALILLLFTDTVWVLVGSLVAEEAIRLAGTYMVQPWKPRLSFSWNTFKLLGRFSRWVTLGTMVTFISLQLDTIVVGRLADPFSLGVYQMAMRISQLPATQIGQIGGTVAFPILSKLQDDIPAFRLAYLRLYRPLFALSLAISLTMITFAETIVAIALGPAWEEAVPVLRILAIAGFMRGILTIAGRVYYALGRPEFDMVINSLRMIIMLILIYPMVSSYGLVGASVTFTASIASVIPIHFWLMHRYSDTSIGDHLSLIRFPEPRRHNEGKF